MPIVLSALGLMTGVRFGLARGWFRGYREDRISAILVVNDYFETCLLFRSIASRVLIFTGLLKDKM